MRLVCPGRLTFSSALPFLTASPSTLGLTLLLCSSFCSSTVRFYYYLSLGDQGGKSKRGASSRTPQRPHPGRPHRSQGSRSVSPNDLNFFFYTASNKDGLILLTKGRKNSPRSFQWKIRPFFFPTSTISLLIRKLRDLFLPPLFAEEVCDQVRVHGLGRLLPTFFFSRYLIARCGGRCCSRRRRRRFFVFLPQLVRQPRLFLLLLPPLPLILPLPPPPRTRKNCCAIPAPYKSYVVRWRSRPSFRPWWCSCVATSPPGGSCWTTPRANASLRNAGFSHLIKVWWGFFATQKFLDLDNTFQ